MQVALSSWRETQKSRGKTKAKEQKNFWKKEKKKKHRKKAQVCKQRLLHQITFIKLKITSRDYRSKAVCYKETNYSHALKELCHRTHFLQDVSHLPQHSPTSRSISLCLLQAAAKMGMYQDHFCSPPNTHYTKYWIYYRELTFHCS